MRYGTTYSLRLDLEWRACQPKGADSFEIKSGDLI